MEQPVSAVNGTGIDKDEFYAMDHEHLDRINTSDTANIGYTGTDMDVVQITQKSPYLERNFIGTYAAVCINCGAGYAGFVLPATSLSLINAQIGPSSNYYWIALAWTLSMSVGYLLVGRLSDIFGRRWFFIGTSFMALVGCIIGATAPGHNGINQLIGANVLIGLASAGQLSFNYMIGELVPIKHRGYAVAGIYLCAVPFFGFGPVIARIFIAHTGPGWRWDYYLSIILDGLAVTLLFLFYHPPQFESLHRNRTRMQEIKDLDFGGIFLFIAGFLLFLMGLSWGGESYPWKSAHVITTIVVGAVLIFAFVLYEIYMPLRRPLMPMHLFLNRDWVVCTVVTSVGGMLYFSLNIVYPTAVQVLYTTDIVYAGLLICAIGGGLGLGEIVGAFFTTTGGHLKAKFIFSTVVATAFTASLAATTTSKTKSTVLLVFAAAGIGMLESLTVVAVTIVIKDQSELGAGVGAYGSIRSMAGVIATAISVSVFTNKVTYYTKTIVVPAVVAAGLPLTSLEAFLTALSTGNEKALLAVPGVTPTIIGAGAVSFKEAYSKAFKVVYLVSIAFGSLAIIAALFAPNLDKRRHAHDVVRRLDGSEALSKKIDEEAEPASMDEKL